MKTIYRMVDLHGKEICEEREYEWIAKSFYLYSDKWEAVSMETTWDDHVPSRKIVTFKCKEVKE